MKAWNFSKGLPWLLLLLSLLASPAGAAFLKDYTSPYSDAVWSLDATDDGGFVFAGSTTNMAVSPLLDKGSLIKLDGMGNVEWQKLYANADRNRLTNIKQTSDGGYVAALYRPLKARIPALVRINPEGEVLWGKSFDLGGGLLAELEQTTDNYLERTADNGTLICFWTYDPAVGPSPWYTWLVKLDDDGNLLWQRRFNFRAVGGFRVCADGGIIMTALTPHVPTPTPGLVKLDADGNIVWQKNYVSPADNILRFFGDVRQTADGGFIVCGTASVSSLSLAQQGYSLIMKLDSAGEIVWQKKVPALGVIGSPFAVWSVVQLQNGGYIFGTSGNYPGVLHLDANGNLLKAENVESYFSFGQNRNGELLYVRPSFGSSGYNGLTRDFRLILTDREGNLPDCAVSSPLQVTVVDADYSAVPGGYIPLPADGSTADVAIVAEAPSSTFSVITHCLAATPNLFVGSTFVDFGSVEFGADTNQSVLLANDGDAVLTISGVTLAGQSGGDFSLATDCAALAPGSSCLATVTFRPTTLGAKEATLVISSDDPDQPTATLPVSGTGIDTTPPVIDLQGEGVVTVEAGITYHDAGASAFDNFDGDLTAEIAVSGAVDTSVVGNYRIAYNVSDSSGNPAAEVSRIVQVVDTIQPVVTVDLQHGALWPPKKVVKPSDLVPLNVGGAATDSGTGVASVEVVITDEYGIYNYRLSGLGQTIGLEAWRDGNDADGRIYTVEVIVTDFAGNTTTSRSSLVVQHDNGN